jgi:hypothetical protein
MQATRNRDEDSDIKTEKHTLKQSRCLSLKKNFVAKKFYLFSIKNLFRLGFILHICIDASYSNSYVNKESGAK